MTHGIAAQTWARAQVEAAMRGLKEIGAFLMAAADLNLCLGVDDDAWTRFSAHWEQLAPDSSAAELGTRRLRRYGHFMFGATDGVARPTTVARCTASRRSGRLTRPSPRGATYW